MLRREAEGDRYLEGFEDSHHAVEPRLGIRPEAVGPGKAGAQMPDAEPLQPQGRVIETVVLEMKPLADAEPRRVIGEMPRRPLRRAVLAQQPHVEMPVIGRTLRLLVAGRRRPSLRQIVEAVPVNPRGAAEQ